MGMMPARWHRGLGTVVPIALPRFSYRAVSQALPARRQAQKAPAQGLLFLLCIRRGGQAGRLCVIERLRRPSAGGGKAPWRGLTHKRLERFQRGPCHCCVSL